MSTTVTITEDDITISGENSGKIVISALGGPEEPVGVTLWAGDFSLTSEQLIEVQLAILNWSNTGYFDREG